jgi:diguanylate cyclase (GGDEF)-like protein
MPTNVIERKIDPAELEAQIKQLLPGETDEFIMQVRSDINELLKPENFVKKIIVLVAEKNRMKNKLEGMRQGFVELTQRITALVHINDSLVVENTDFQKQLSKAIKELTGLWQQYKILEKKYNERMVDYLTGLYKRDIFEIQFPQMLAQQRRAGEGAVKEVSFVILDIDFFKKVNDTYGHSGGDEVLKAVGEIIRSTLRRKDSDIAYRYGGEELVIVYVGCTQEKALELANEIRLKIENTPIKVTETDTIHITVSGGVTTVNGMKAPLEILKKRAELIADAALYKSKEDGRNRITGERDLDAKHYEQLRKKHNVSVRYDEHGKVVFDDINAE